MKLEFMFKLLEITRLRDENNKFPLLCLNIKEERKSIPFSIWFSNLPAGKEMSTRYKVLDDYDWVNYKNKKL